MLTYNSTTQEKESTDTKGDISISTQTGGSANVHVCSFVCVCVVCLCAYENPKTKKT